MLITKHGEISSFEILVFLVKRFFLEHVDRQEINDQRCDGKQTDTADELCD